jgi:poly-gamma-glutamate capsule biosynthesis protein CapA/YwtB (metallophosphatase superfamily)
MRSFNLRAMIAVSIALLSVFLAPSVLAQCYLPQLPKQPKPNLLEVYPTLFLSKGWSASEEMIQYFDHQKRLFQHMPASQVDGAQSLSLASVGDIMRIPSPQQFVDPALLHHLGSYDLLFGNLETLISDDIPMPPQDLFLMNSDPAVLSNFNQTAGENTDSMRNVFSALSLANNHLYDYDDNAIVDTLDQLARHGIAHSGVNVLPNERPYAVLEVRGIKVAYYAVTTLMNDLEALAETKLAFNPMLEGIDSTPFRTRTNPCELDYSHIESVVAQMDQDGVDFKVLSLHWGFEHEMYPRPAQMQVSRALTALGFDIILGAHSHTPQPAEICFFNGYEQQMSMSAELQAVVDSGQHCQLTTQDGRPRKSITFYSLGNFNSYTNIFWQQVGTIANLTLQKSDQGNDWHSPAYTITFDYTFNPPNGNQYLTFLPEEDGFCPLSACPNDVDSMKALPARHLLGAGPTTTEKFWWAWQSLSDSVYTFAYWLLGDEAALN